MRTESKQNGNRETTEWKQKVNTMGTESQQKANRHFSQFSQKRFGKQKEERKALDLLMVSNLLPNDKSPHPLV